MNSMILPKKTKVSQQKQVGWDRIDDLFRYYCGAKLTTLDEGGVARNDIQSDCLSAES